MSATLGCPLARQGHVAEAPAQRERPHDVRLHRAVEDHALHRAVVAALHQHERALRVAARGRLHGMNAPESTLRAPETSRGGSAPSTSGSAQAAEGRVIPTMSAMERVSLRKGVLAHGITFPRRRTAQDAPR